MRGMIRLAGVVLALAGVAYPRAEEHQQVICSYNIVSFSDSKLKAGLADLVSVISGCGIISIQELLDRDETTATALRDNLDGYNYVVSGLLGENVYKERLLLFYRRADFKVVKTYQSFNDTGVVDYGKFVRPPFTVQFEVLRTGYPFSVTSVHNTPNRPKLKDATSRTTHTEMNALVGVYDRLVELWGKEDMKYAAIVGDLNAGLSSYPKRWWDNALKQGPGTRNELWHDQRFQWLTGRNFGTMVANNYAHDKIIVTAALNSSTARNEVTTITDFNVDLSDHLPIASTLVFPFENNFIEGNGGGTAALAPAYIIIAATLGVW